ncbi:MAG: phage holin family protein [Coriobacteriales bacterium]|jgi:putative membrane protein|nr:phage holin family protein [Coriobacteriales bacterium]
MNFIARWVICAVAVAVAVWLIPGIDIHTQYRLVAIGAFALFLALINVSIKPIVQIIALPFTVLTFGVLYLIINTALLYLASWLTNVLFGIDFVIEGFLSALLASIIISVVTIILNALTGVKDSTN